MKRTGKILRIEKTSIHDGEGLRTVVFFKGCPLRCKWCSTPESQNIEEPGYGCEMTVDKVIREICKDEIFFFHSGGGVTLSGGEVLMQATFAEEVLKGCIEQGISTAIETSLYTSSSQIERLLPYLNAIYIDYKMDNETSHRVCTGVSNQLIKENLKFVDNTFGGDIHIRIPMIPTINMTAENMRKSAVFFRQLRNVKDIELLPYHRLGVETYRKLGRKYEMEEIKTPGAEEMKEMAKILLQELPGWRIKMKILTDN